MDMWQDINYLLMHSTRTEEKILGDDYKAVNALAKGRKNEEFLVRPPAIYPHPKASPKEQRDKI